MTFLSMDEESWCNRKSRVAGSRRLTQNMYVFSAPDDIPTPFGNERLHHSSTSTRSDIIQGLKVPAFETTWLVTHQEKTEMLGGNGVVRTGGGQEEWEKYERPSLRRLEQPAEPANWHSVSQEFYEELIWSYGLHILVVTTVMDDMAAMAGICRKTPVVLLVFTPAQKQQLHERLQQAVWNEMRVATSSLHEPGLTKLLGSASNITGERLKRPRGVGKPKVVAKKRARRNKPKREEDHEDEEEEDPAQTPEDGDDEDWMPNLLHARAKVCNLQT